MQFAGTNTITTDAPGYTETITFGNGRWSRTRNGVTRIGRLDDEEGTRIAEQTKHTIDGIMRHTAEVLAGMMGSNGNMFGDTGYFNPARPLSPNGIAAPQSSGVSIPPGGRGRGRGGSRGAFRRRGINDPSGDSEHDVFGAGRGGPDIFGEDQAMPGIFEASGNFGSPRDTRKSAENTIGADGGGLFESPKDLPSSSVGAVYESTSEPQDDVAAKRSNAAEHSKKRIRTMAADMFERNGSG